MMTPARSGIIALGLALGALLGFGDSAQASPCSVLEANCAPTTCRTANPLCDDGQVCVHALDNPPCPDTNSPDCRDNGYCATLTQSACQDHAGCQGAEVCYHEGMPLCHDSDQQEPQSPPCSAPTSIPQGHCAPATECAQDQDCRSGFACQRYSLQMGPYRTTLGVCAPQQHACQQDTDCPEGVWQCQDDLCVPDGHHAVCQGDGCQLWRDEPGLPLSSPQSATGALPMSEEPPAAPQAEDAGGCQTQPGRPTPAHHALLALLGLLVLHQRRR